MVVYLMNILEKKEMQDTDYATLLKIKEWTW